LQVETPDQIMSKVEDQLIYGLPQGYWKNYRDTVIHVEAAEVRKAALRYIHALPVVVVVGDAKEIRAQIKAVLPTAKLVEYDAELRRK
jgi:predicted Zn-dependent peptidase